MDPSIKFFKITPQNRKQFLELSQFSELAMIFLSLDFIITDFNEIAKKIHNWEREKILNTSYVSWCEANQIQFPISFEDKTSIANGFPLHSVKKYNDNNKILLQWKIIGNLNEKEQLTEFILIGKEIPTEKSYSAHLENSTSSALLTGLKVYPAYILLVEDQPLATEITKIILSDLNCRVDIARNGTTAIEKAKNHQYDLIFMDLGLPDMNGYKATQQIRFDPLSQNKNTLIIALTAHADNEERKRCIEFGMNAILNKPLYKEKIQEIIAFFIPKNLETKIPTAANDAIDWSLLSGKIIDLELGARLFNGNTELAKKMISSMIVSFYSELEKLERAYKSEDWETLEAIAHQFRGEVSYCGTPRLQEACARLENHLKAGYRELIPLLYKQLLKEINAVKKAHLELI